MILFILCLHVWYFYQLLITEAIIPDRVLNPIMSISDELCLTGMAGIILLNCFKKSNIPYLSKIFQREDTVELIEIIPRLLMNNTLVQVHNCHYIALCQSFFFFKYLLCHFFVLLILLWFLWFRFTKLLIKMIRIYRKGTICRNFKRWLLLVQLYALWFYYFLDILRNIF